VIGVQRHTVVWVRPYKCTVSDGYGQPIHHPSILDNRPLTKTDRLKDGRCTEDGIVMGVYLHIPPLYTYLPCTIAPAGTAQFLHNDYGGGDPLGGLGCYDPGLQLPWTILSFFYSPCKYYLLRLRFHLVSPTLLRLLVSLVDCASIIHTVPVSDYRLITVDILNAPFHPYCMYHSILDPLPIRLVRRPSLVDVLCVYKETPSLGSWALSLT